MTKKRSLLSIMMTLVLALTMVFAMTVTAFADETDNTYTLTLNNTGKTAHTFEVYQIFTGDLSEKDGVTALSNIKWGTGITDEGQTALQNKYVTDEGKEKNAVNVAEKVNDTNATVFAQDVAKYLSSPIKTTTSVAAKGSVDVTGLAPGYYFVKDTANSQTGKDSAYTSYILEVVKDTTASTKLDVPTVVKKVQDINESESTERTGWQDSADYKIGQEIPYQITGTLPSNYDDYKTYFYQFTDTMSKGLDYTKKVTIKVGEEDITDKFTEVITTNDDGSKTVTWTCNDLKAIEGVTLTKDSQIIVSYECKLNDKAVMGEAGNPNTVKLTYSNNPNHTSEGTPDKGETPEDTNIVFTYNVTVNKYSESVADANKLTGAGFTLYKEIVKKDGSKSWVAVGNEVKGKALTTFSWDRVDDGNYKLEETTVPTGYNKMADVIFNVTASHDTEADSPKLTALSGNVTSGTATFTASNNKSSLSSDVINKKGSTLPSTGGMGTTLFYLIGVILVLGSGVVLVTRRRMSR